MDDNKYGVRPGLGGRDARAGKSAREPQQASPPVTHVHVHVTPTRAGLFEDGSPLIAVLPHERAQIEVEDRLKLLCVGNERHEVD